MRDYSTVRGEFRGHEAHPEYRTMIPYSIPLLFQIIFSNIGMPFVSIILNPGGIVCTH